jgi:hypothetical protein
MNSSSKFIDQQLAFVGFSEAAGAFITVKREAVDR